MNCNNLHGAKPLIPIKKNVLYKQPSKPWLKSRVSSFGQKIRDQLAL